MAPTLSSRPPAEAGTGQIGWPHQEERPLHSPGGRLPICQCFFGRQTVSSALSTSQASSFPRGPSHPRLSFQRLPSSRPWYVLAVLNFFLFGDPEVWESSADNRLLLPAAGDSQLSSCCDHTLDKDSPCGQPCRISSIMWALVASSRLRTQSSKFPGESSHVDSMRRTVSA